MGNFNMLLKDLSSILLQVQKWYNYLINKYLHRSFNVSFEPLSERILARLSFTCVYYLPILANWS